MHYTLLFYILVWRHRCLWFVWRSPVPRRMGKLIHTILKISLTNGTHRVQFTPSTRKSSMMPSSMLNRSHTADPKQQQFGTYYGYQIWFPMDVHILVTCLQCQAPLTCPTILMADSTNTVPPASAIVGSNHLIQQPTETMHMLKQTHTRERWAQWVVKGSDMVAQPSEAIKFSPCCSRWTCQPPNIQPLDKCMGI